MFLQMCVRRQLSSVKRQRLNDNNDNDDDENDNERTTRLLLADEIQGQTCQALKNTMRTHMCVCMSTYVSMCGHLAAIVPLIFLVLFCLFIYTFIYLGFVLT